MLADTVLSAVLVREKVLVGVGGGVRVSETVSDAEASGVGDSD